MLKVLFFGQLKDVIKTEQLELDFQQQSLQTVAMLRTLLQSKGDIWNEYLTFGKALVAVNQEICSDSTILKEGDEIAFFPPVTGG
mgnify:CR=1 FL=1